MTTLSTRGLPGYQEEVVIFYIAVSGMTLQIYDFFQTLELEVEYIWKSPFTPFKLLYVFMKYLPYVDVSLLIILNHATLMSQECRTLNLITGWSFVVGVAATQVVLTLRTWVLWDRSRWLGFALVAFALFWATYGVYVNNSVLQSINFVSLDQGPFGCAPKTGSRYARTWINWMLQLIYDGLLCILLVIRVAIESRRGRVPRPIFIIYQDGISYYFYLLIMSLALIFWIKYLGSQFPVPAILLSRVIHPILAARVVLHARQQAHQDTWTQQTHGVLSTVDIM